jgi:hypothetical protein
VNESVKKQWVEALRSGEYQQGREALRRQSLDGDRFCCLGVLCELAAKAEVIPQPRLSGRRTFSYGVGHAEENTAYPPRQVWQWADLGTRDPMVKVEGIYRSLATLNDSGKDFATIAALIEAHL